MRKEAGNVDRFTVHRHLIYWCCYGGCALVHRLPRRCLDTRQPNWARRLPIPTGSLLYPALDSVARVTSIHYSLVYEKAMQAAVTPCFVFFHRRMCTRRS